MTTFQTIVLVMLVTALSVQFVASIERECFRLSAMFAFEIMAFAYLANTLM